MSQQDPQPTSPRQTAARASQPSFGSQTPVHGHGATEAKLSGEPRNRGSRILAWVLPAVLGLGAVGVHFWLNVPSAQALAKHKRQLKKPKKNKRKPKRTKRPAAKAFKARPAAEFAAEFERLKTTEFVKEKTTNPWSRRAKSWLNKSVAVARKQAFEGAPEEPKLVVRGMRCRTIRCRLTLRSAFEHEVVLMREVLEGLTVDGQSLWLDFQAEVVEPKTKGDETHQLQVTVAFASDEIEVNDIRAKNELPGEDPDPQPHAAKASGSKLGSSASKPAASSNSVTPHSAAGGD